MAETVAMRLALEHEVTVLCGRPSYDPSERSSWKLWQPEHQGNVEVVRVGSTDFPRCQMIKRLLNYLTYVALTIPLALSTPGAGSMATTGQPFAGILVCAGIWALYGKGGVWWRERGGGSVWGASGGADGNQGCKALVRPFGMFASFPSFRPARSPRFLRLRTPASSP